MWEFLIKLSVSSFIVVAAGGSLYWIWTHQIDPGATLGRIFKGATQPDWVATRDPNTLYVGGQPAARITGPVEDGGTSVLFRQLADAPDLSLGLVLEYQRRRLVVRGIGSIIGISSTASPGRTEVLRNVREDVLCEVLE